ncbi:MAG: braC 1 [Burkholderiaceae bacterium]|nr:braC 1 [Burkholderiaceae bacterium]
MYQTFKFLPLVAAVALVACGGDKSSDACGKLDAGQVCVKIGHGAPRTGGIAHLGKDNENGAQLAVNEINAKGGIKVGDKVVKLALVGEDDAADPKQGPVVAQKLLDAGVVGVVGHLTSGVTIPASAVYAKAGVVEISPSSTNPDYTLKGEKTPKGSVSTYRMVATDAMQGPAMGRFMLNKGAKTVAILDDSTQYGKGLADQVEKTLKDGGVQVVAHEASTATTTDFKAILTKIKGMNPDYLFWGGMDDTAASLVKQMKELGMTTKLASADGPCTKKFIDLAGDAGEGVVCSQAGMPLSKMAKGAQYNANYEKTFVGQKVQIYSPFAYDAVYALAEAMKIAGSTEREAIAAAMPKVNFSGLTGQVAFDEKGDIKGGAISIFQVINKNLEVIDIIK